VSNYVEFEVPMMLNGFPDYHDLYAFAATLNRVFCEGDDLLRVHELPLDEARPLTGCRGVLYMAGSEDDLASYLVLQGFAEAKEGK